MGTAEGRLSHNLFCGRVAGWWNVDLPKGWVACPKIDVNKSECVAESVVTCVAGSPPKVEDSASGSPSPIFRRQIRKDLRVRGISFGPDEMALSQKLNPD